MVSNRPAVAVVRETPRKAERTSQDAGFGEILAQAKQSVRAQALALTQLADRLDGSFAAAVALLIANEGRVAILGVGKSGIIGRKIASTLASTGTPALFINAAEARHGDLGMVTPHDVVVLISNSGETEEIVALLPHLRELAVPMIAIVGRTASTLARSVDVVLDVAVEAETCPLGLAPTTSALTALAIGDALAVALMRERGFGVEDFRRTHPGGSLGRGLGARVRDRMRRPPLPVVAPGDMIGKCLGIMTDGGLGLVLVKSGERLVGLITDGDLRRALARGADVRELCVAEIMTRNPATVTEETLMADAMARMQAMRLKALVVLGDDGRVSGVVEVFNESTDVERQR